MQAWLTFSEIVRNIGLLVGGAVGIYLAWKRVVASSNQADAQIRQADLSRRNHVTELFNRAVGQLKDERLEVRLGAILTLGQICSDFRDLSNPIVKLLGTYLHLFAGDPERLCWPRPGRRCRNRPHHGLDVAGDCGGGLMTSIIATTRKPLKIDVSRTFIRRTDWSDANLNGADFSYADCESALFRRVNFKNTILEKTNLKGADLSDARNLTRAQLDSAIIDATTILPSYLRAEMANEVA